jgi:hypothetical protein
MRKHRVTFPTCKNQKPMILNVRDENILEGDINNLVSWLGSYIASGAVIQDGDTIQIGWMTCLVRKREDETLGLFEPDMKTMPIQWIDGVDLTITIMRLHRNVGESYDVVSDLIIPSYRESCVVGEGYLDAEILLLERSSPLGSDSGWFVGDASRNQDYRSPLTLSRTSLYEVGCQRIEVVQFLCLPVGFRILLSPTLLRTEFQGREIIPKKGSYVDLISRVPPILGHLEC